MKFPKYLITMSQITNKLTFGPKGFNVCARFYMWKNNENIIGKLLVKITDTLFFFDKNIINNKDNLL